MVDVRGDVLRPPHGTTPAAVKAQAQHLLGTVGELKRSLPRTLALLSPAHPRRWGEGVGGQWLQMTGALL